MSRSIAQDTADHVRWVASDAQTIAFDFDRDGSVRVTALQNLSKRVATTLKLLKKQRMWETI